MGETEKIIIFAGTTEGRELSDRLCKAGYKHLVSVASEYGSCMLRPDENRTVHTGRMDSAQMADLLKSCGFGCRDKIVDATHPYATEVSLNITEASKLTGAEYIRVLRDGNASDGEGICLYDDLASCAEAVDKTEGNILLTTGSKELKLYCDTVSEETLSRTYVRVLPAAESIDICSACGIDRKKIIAMHGPFSAELNAAMIRQYDIAHLITKQSGKQGGFYEKAQAARMCGALCHVIRRPSEEEGCGLKEVYTMLTGKDWDTKELKHIFLIGTGMGSGAVMTAQAHEALKQAEVVFGAQRLIAPLDKSNKYPLYLAKDIIPFIKGRTDIESCAILFSGDSGFYSGAAKLYRALLENGYGDKTVILPGISSVSYLAAAMGVSYDDAAVYSLHGKNSDADIAAVSEAVRTHAKTFVLLSGSGDISRLTERLKKDGVQAELYAGCDMSYENEFIGPLRELPADKELITLFISNEKPEKRKLINVFRDDAFIRGKVPMTKECIRHESIIRLGLKEKDVLYDIGGGTGSVAMEAAALHPSLKVYTIEKKQEACELIRENLNKNRICNVTLIEGDAAEAVKELEKPDCVFIGGSGGRLWEILDAIGQKGSGIRVVINAISLETMEEIMCILREKKITDEEMVSIAVSDIKHMGAYHLPQANNPVTIVSFSL